MKISALQKMLIGFGVCGLLTACDGGGSKDKDAAAGSNPNGDTSGTGADGEDDDDTNQEPSAYAVLADSIVAKLVADEILTAEEAEALKTATKAEIDALAEAAALTESEVSVQVASILAKHAPDLLTDVLIQYFGVCFDQALASHDAAEQDGKLGAIALGMLSSAQTDAQDHLSHAIGTSVAKLYMPTNPDELAVGNTRYDEVLTEIGSMLAEKYVASAFVFGLSHAVITPVKDDSSRIAPVASKLGSVLAEGVLATTMDSAGKLSLLSDVSSGVTQGTADLMANLLPFAMPAASSAAAAAVSKSVLTAGLASLEATDRTSLVEHHASNIIDDVLYAHEDSDFSSVYPDIMKGVIEGVLAASAADNTLAKVSLLQSVSQGMNIQAMINATGLSNMGGYSQVYVNIVTGTFPLIQSHMTALELVEFTAHMMTDFVNLIDPELGNLTGIMENMEEAGDSLILDGAKETAFTNGIDAIKSPTACAEGESMIFAAGAFSCE